MKRCIRYVGLLAILIGVVLDVIEFIVQPRSNVLLLCGLAFILVGSFAHVWLSKHSGEF